LPEVEIDKFFSEHSLRELLSETNYPLAFALQIPTGSLEIVFYENDSLHLENCIGRRVMIDKG
jgi:hypothetical protein